MDTYQLADFHQRDKYAHFRYTNVVIWRSLQNPWQILLKFNLTSFQVKVVIPPNFGLGLLSGLKREVVNKTKKRQKETKHSKNIRPTVTNIRVA